jgi:hypothetical protein
MASGKNCRKNRVESDSYNAVFDPEKQALRGKNTSNWNDYPIKTNTYQGQTP